VHPSSVAPLIATADLDRSIAFYRKLGFEPLAHWESYAKLAAGDNAVLHVAAAGPAPSDRPTVAMASPSGPTSTAQSIMVIEVDDCQDACRRLVAAGVSLLTEPAVPSWGGEVRAFLHDPDGHLIELNQPTGPADPH
jgi:catechol 2,3-dioxygenase-like lactoylglutathione lyase family enzyme